MEARLIGKNKTRVKLSNKKEKYIIEQLKFLELHKLKKVLSSLILNLMEILQQQLKILG